MNSSAMKSFSQADAVTAAILGCCHFQKLLRSCMRTGSPDVEYVRNLLVFDRAGIPIKCKICGREWPTVRAWSMDQEH